MESKDKKISFFSKYKKLLLPIIVVAIGFMGMKTLVMTKAAPFKMPKKQSGVLVETLTARHGEHQVLIEGNGTVQAAKEIALTPQVSGKVTYLAPAFKAGGFFKKGELLFRIESEDYKLAVDKARATVARAKVELATVEGQARIARLEWERLKEHVDEEPNPLVLHEPQLNNARANVDSAKAALRRAELDHERTKIFAPFKCRVRSESIDIGQFIRSGETVGVIAGTEEVEIIVALPFENLYWIKIPRMGKKNNGSIAIVSLKVGDKLHSWEGRVIRSFGELDPQGRLSRIAIGIKD
ncbi:MAG: HlyD family efflux transporter periplasmic adaptor subunit, partial [Deltaproteobacteria bacterium]|nr:HlyD family efflux transporter periplasmic adaptor subunit [Deltaproteobacteria bacterium]